MWECIWLAIFVVAALVLVWAILDWGERRRLKRESDEWCARARRYMDAIDSYEEKKE